MYMKQKPAISLPLKIGGVDIIVATRPKYPPIRDYFQVALRNIVRCKNHISCINCLKKENSVQYWN